ncbi:hypothetical protein V8G54_010494 [Vigna mungo]|uniref:Uncharacterized protein n=1 Tax=Vigna mungo TaxID=3915 RepID=A0AAQ3NZ66_VIGMU
MADPSTPPPSQSEDKSQSSIQPKRRRATRLKDLTISRSADQRLPIQFDMSTGKILGDNRVRFTSFVALLGRSKVSILIDKWDHVPEEVKNQIWQTIMDISKKTNIVTPPQPQLSPLQQLGAAIFDDSSPMEAPEIEDIRTK